MKVYLSFLFISFINYLPLIIVPEEVGWEVREMINQVRGEVEELRMGVERKLVSAKEAFVRKVGGKEEVNGGWSDSLHSKFLSIRNQATSAMKTRRRTLDALVEGFEGEVGREEVEEHEKWVVLRELLGGKVRDIRVEGQRREEIALATGHTKICEVFEVGMRDWQEKEEWEEFLEMRGELKERLGVLRNEKAVRDEEERKVRCEKQRTEEEERKRMEEERRREMDAKKSAVEEYLIEKEEELRKERELLKLEEEEEKKRKRDRMGKNKGRVRYRKIERAEKLLENLRKERRAMVEKERRERALVKISESVPYFQNIQEMEADIHKSTIATDGWSSFEGLELGPYGDMLGFSDTKIMSDVKFRIGCALREAGLNQTNYAHSVIQKLHPRPKAPI